MQRGAHFWIVIFFPVHLGVVCGPSGGVQKIYKTNVFLHFLKKTRGRKRQKSSKYIGKYNTFHGRYGRSLASTCADPFFGVLKVGAPVALQK